MAENPKNNLRNKSKVIRAVIVMGVLLCIAIMISAVFNVTTPNILRGDPALIYIDEEYEGFREELYSDFDRNERTFLFELPEIPSGGETLAVWLVHRDVEISIDGDVMFDSGPLDASWITSSPGNYWALVPVYSRDSGGEVVIRSVDAYAGIPDRTPDIMVASMERLVAYCLSREWIEMAAGFLCVVLGGVFATLAFVLHADRDQRIGAGYMGLYISMVGVFRLLDMPLITLVFNKHSLLITYISLILFMWIPFIFYMSATFQSKGVRLYSYWSAYFAVINIICFVLQIARLRDLRQNVLLIYAGMLLSFLSIIFQTVYDHTRKKNIKEAQWFPAIYILMGISLTADLILFKLNGHTRQSNISLYTSLVYGIISGFSMIAEIMSRQEEYRLKELELSDQRGAMMLSQIRPHFVYNTMNTIYSLCDIDVESAKCAIHDFSGYLRLNFSFMDYRNPIDFSLELQHTRFYLSIEKLRFGDDLDVEYDIKTEDFRIPPLTLQPIVENAVRHGIRGKTGKGKVNICTEEEYNDYVVQVEDNGAGFDVSILNHDDVEDEHRHIAVKNVSARIEQMCGGRVDIVSTIGEGTKVTIVIPKIRPEK